MRTAVPESWEAPLQFLFDCAPIHPFVASWTTFFLAALNGNDDCWARALTATMNAYSRIQSASPDEKRIVNAMVVLSNGLAALKESGEHEKVIQKQETELAARASHAEPAKPAKKSNHKLHNRNQYAFPGRQQQR